jgi:hypothetical protein
MRALHESRGILWAAGSGSGQSFVQTLRWEKRNIASTFILGGMTFEFGGTEASKAFLQRNQKFLPKFERLLDLANKCFGRQLQPKNRTEDICFGLGHTCREDFMEIVFLCANGYSNAGLKLLRGLYERAVALAYIVKFPEKADRFMNFAAIQEHRAMEAAVALVGEEEFDKVMGPKETVAEIRKRFQAIRPDFQRTISWDQSVGAMAKELGVSYSQSYLACYAIPNFAIHATLASAARWEGHGNSESEADFVVLNAALVLVLVLDSQTKLFGLNLETEIATLWQDLMEKPDTDA